jgi:hypothetical protein
MKKLKKIKRYHTDVYLFTNQGIVFFNAKEWFGKWTKDEWLEQSELLQSFSSKDRNKIIIELDSIYSGCFPYRFFAFDFTYIADIEKIKLVNKYLSYFSKDALSQYKHDTVQDKLNIFESLREWEIDVIRRNGDDTWMVGIGPDHTKNGKGMNFEWVFKTQLLPV